MLLLRDTTLIPNVLWFEYTSSRQEARARSRKLVPMKAQWPLPSGGRSSIARHLRWPLSAKWCRRFARFCPRAICCVLLALPLYVIYHHAFTQWTVRQQLCWNYNINIDGIKLTSLSILMTNLIDYSATNSRFDRM